MGPIFAISWAAPSRLGQSRVDAATIHANAISFGVITAEAEADARTAHIRQDGEPGTIEAAPGVS